MATNMFVTGIPNGTSLDIQKGTALYLLKALKKAVMQDSEGGHSFDSHRVEQLAGCLGISSEEAIHICTRALGDETEEGIISEYVLKGEELKDSATSTINQKLRELRGELHE
ncbi:MAG TPA: hypothetical protein VHS59_05040 [Bacillota bacterium]|nr:hypothetical protein [Bacillota bacterium]